MAIDDIPTMEIVEKKVQERKNEIAENIVNQLSESIVKGIENAIFNQEKIFTTSTYIEGYEDWIQENQVYLNFLKALEDKGYTDIKTEIGNGYLCITIILK